MPSGTLTALAEDAGAIHAYRFDPRGARPERIVAGERRVTSLAARAGTLAYVTSGPADPPRLVVATGDGGEREVHAPNATVASARDLRGPEHRVGAGGGRNRDRFVADAAGSRGVGTARSPPALLARRRHPVRLPVVARIPGARGGRLRDAAGEPARVGRVRERVAADAVRAGRGDARHGLGLGRHRRRGRGRTGHARGQRRARPGPGRGAGRLVRRAGHGVAARDDGRCSRRAGPSAAPTTW